MSPDSTDESSTKEKLLDYFGAEEGHLFLLECHKRKTAQIIKARYDRGDRHATGWSHSKVAVHIPADEYTQERKVEEIRSDIPEQEILLDMTVGECRRLLRESTPYEVSGDE